MEEAKEGTDEIGITLTGAFFFFSASSASLTALTAILAAYAAACGAKREAFSNYRCLVQAFSNYHEQLQI